MTATRKCVDGSLQFLEWNDTCLMEGLSEIGWHTYSQIYHKSNFLIAFF
jgi:hypothetical protein